MEIMDSVEILYSMEILYSFLAVSILSFIHFFIGRLHFLEKHPHSRYFSFSGGIAIAYVFTVTFPKLAKMNEKLMQTGSMGIYGFLEHHAYLVAMIGFILYYGTNFLSERCLSSSKECHSFQLGIRTFLAAYVPVFMFGAYAFLAAYLISENTNSNYLLSVLLTSFAMTLHFVGIDHGLRHRYAEYYDGRVRWILVIFTYCGWITGILTESTENNFALWYAFLSGAVIINAIKDELPEHHPGSFGAFLGGVLTYTLLILSLE